MTDPNETTVDATEDAPDNSIAVVPQSVDERVYELMAGLSIEDFGKLSAKDRDMVLYAAFRTQLGMLQYLTQTVSEFEAKAKALASPEGIQNLMGQFLGSGGLGSMLGSMGGKF